MASKLSGAVKLVAGLVCHSPITFRKQRFIARPLFQKIKSNVASSNSEAATVIRESCGRNSTGFSEGKRQGGTFLKWLAMSTLVAGGSLYIYGFFIPDVRELRDKKHYYSNWKLRVYCSLPLNALSRFAGGAANTTIPIWLRPKLFGLFVRAYDCRMDEALVEDLSAYPTFAAFFNRPLKKMLRPISDAPLVSPADGVVIHYGKVHNGRIEYVKGHDYNVSEFLGPIEIEKQLQKSKGERDLYQMVIYLAPGNYHSFHSPASWTCDYEIHHPGLLLSVRPSVLDKFPYLFCVNERVVLNGHWKHGFFSLSAVAATNVGDVTIDADPHLRTNVRRAQLGHDKPVAVATSLSHSYAPGEKVGEFKLGSTVVIIFEAPSTIEFAVRAGDRLRYGQSLVKCGV
uniref:Phosphatidylserine decarboxylase proenzyme, mitochondrial n=1 Tax=Parascaris univalens TaxID=6257 RepID=A0A915APL7_PARUN